MSARCCGVVTPTETTPDDGSGFTDKLTNGYSLVMALSTAVALACYALGLFAASTRR